MASTGRVQASTEVPELLHEVNQRIRELAADFTVSAGDELPQEYLCECGCGEWVSLRADEFDATIKAQQPVTVQGHVVSRAKVARQFSHKLREEAAALRAEARQKVRKCAELARQNPKRLTD